MSFRAKGMSQRSRDPARLGDTYQSRSGRRSATNAWRQAREILTDLDHPQRPAQAHARLSITTPGAI